MQQLKFHKCFDTTGFFGGITCPTTYNCTGIHILRVLCLLVVSRCSQVVFFTCSFFLVFVFSTSCDEVNRRG